jgi:nucleotide-binding universal stress UspA family protein
VLEARCQAAGVPVTGEILAGGVSEMVLQAVKEARLLAIGRRGHGHEGDFQHLGQSFRVIAHRTRLPVIIGGDETRTVHRLLLAYDASPRAQRALSWASQLQHTLSAQVGVVAIQGQGQSSAQDWLAKARAQLDSCHCLLRQGQPAAGIVAAAQETHADLIVMGRYRHAALLEWLMGSTVDRVLRDSQLPVLMV